jgi:uncharacterized coiled-coil DUF342 family protein
MTEIIVDEVSIPFPSLQEINEHRCNLLQSELDETNRELRACRQRIAFLVVQHGQDNNELSRLKTELARLAIDLSEARPRAEPDRSLKC